MRSTTTIRQPLTRGSTNIANLNGAVFAPESGGSGIDNIFNNAEWLLKASGQYTTPLWDINVAGRMQDNEEYPFPQQSHPIATRRQYERLSRTARVTSVIQERVRR